MQVGRAQDGRADEPEQHGGVVGDQPALSEQQDAADQRVVPRSALGSSMSTSRPAHASEQQEVNGHEPARPDVSPGTNSTRPGTLAPIVVKLLVIWESGLVITSNYR